MAIITISRGSYHRGKEVAEKLAQKLGYSCISREILLDASEEYNIPEIKLIRAIKDAPTILEKLTRQKSKYLAYVRAALLKHVARDNIVYHGLFGHFFLQDIPHVLKVRIVADMDARVADEVKRSALSENKAREILMRDDEERRKWALDLYGADWWDATLWYNCLSFKPRLSRRTPSTALRRRHVWRRHRCGGMLPRNKIYI